MPFSRHGFFSEKCSISSRSIIKVLAQALRLATTVEIGGEIYLTSQDAYVEIAILLAVCTAYQSGWLLKGNELVHNAERFSNWLRGAKSLQSPKVENTKSFNELNTIEKCQFGFSKTFTALNIGLGWLSMFVVPAGEFFRGRFTARKLLCDRNLLQLSPESLIVKILAPVSGAIDAYYSLGTEGVSAYESLKEKNATCKCNNCNICLGHTKLLACSDYSQRAVGGTKGGLGALNHGIKEAATIFLLTLALVSYSPLAIIITIGILTLNLMFQNFTFQGREFRKNVQKIFDFMFGGRRGDYQEIRESKMIEDVQKPELSTGTKIAIHVPTLILLTLVAFLGHFGLFRYTLISGLEEYLKRDEVSSGQNIYCSFFAAAATITETFTESSSAHEQVEEGVYKLKFPELEEIQTAPQMVV